MKYDYEVVISYLERVDPSDPDDHGPKFWREETIGCRTADVALFVFIRKTIGDATPNLSHVWINYPTPNGLGASCYWHGNNRGGNSIVDIKKILKNAEDNLRQLQFNFTEVVV